MTILPPPRNAPMIDLTAHLELPHGSLSVPEGEQPQHLRLSSYAIRRIQRQIAEDAARSMKRLFLAFVAFATGVVALVYFLSE